MSWQSFLIPITMILGYVSYQGLRVIGRTKQIFLPVVIIALIVAFGVGAVNADLTNTLPMLAKGFGPVFNAAVKHLIVFNDIFILFFFMGNVKPEKKLKTKLCFGVVSGMLITLAFLVLFNAVYDRIALGNRQGIADIAEFLPHISAIIRFDWLTTLIWTSVVLLKMTILIYCIYICFLWVFGLQKNFYVFLTICASSYFISTMPTLNVEVLSDFFYSTSMTIVGIVQYIVPYLFPVFLIVYNKKGQAENNRYKPIKTYKIKEIKNVW